MVERQHAASFSALLPLFLLGRLRLDDGDPGWDFIGSVPVSSLCFARGVRQGQSPGPAQARYPIHYFVWMGSAVRRGSAGALSGLRKADASGEKNMLLIFGPASLVLAAVAHHFVVPGKG